MDLIVESGNYSADSGLRRLPSSLVAESKVGTKFFYSIHPNVQSSYNRLFKFITNNYLRKIPLNQSACAYVEGKSYLDFLSPHRNNYFFIRLDIKNFFLSINESLLRRRFLEYFSDENYSNDCEQRFSDAILHLVSYVVPENSKNISYRGRAILPIGFPLSPIVSNIVFRKTDILLERLCSENFITYSRYADDMLFSCRGTTKFKNFSEMIKGKSISDIPFMHTDMFLNSVKSILALDGFNLNYGKTIKAINTISLNGYTVSGVNHSDAFGFIRVSNKKTEIIEKLIYELKKKNSDDVEVFKKCFPSEVPTPRYQNKSQNYIRNYCKSQIDNKLVGYKSYLVSFHIYNDRFGCVDILALEKYSKIINEINLLVERRFR